MHFHSDDGYLYCERLSVKDIQARVPDSPFYLYSAAQLRENFAAYVAALEGMQARIFYAVKANGNLTLLKILRELGSAATLVSGNELRMALRAGFAPGDMLLNGNGKRRDEMALAVQHGVMVNIDSEFDLAHIAQAAQAANKPVEVLLRVNPDIRADVHPYVATGMRDSKFGIRAERLAWFLDQLKRTPLLRLVGLHCHLGSTIKDVRVFHDAAALMSDLLSAARAQGFALRYLNLGGGLGIDYERAGGFPTPGDLIGAVRKLLPDDVTLIVEPGRSIVGNAGVLVCRVLGVKANGDKHFIVADGSMTELIRPSLYGAYHHIGFVEPVDGEVQTFDVVGPVCESADFLGKARALPTPHEDAGLVVYDAGAYGYAMSSNYNLRARPAEYLVDGDRLLQIRRAQTFDDFLDYPILEFDPTREAIIEPSRLVPRHNVPEHCVICFFQDVINGLVESGRARHIVDGHSEIGRHPLYEIDVDGKRVAVFHPGVGAPLAAGLLEEVIARGCRAFIACGGAGVLDSEIAVGHIVVPTAAVRDEGVSYHYMPPSREVQPSPEAVAAIERVLERHKLPYIAGKTWTTDAFYRETPDKTRRRREEGCLTVEMEAATFFAVARFRGVTFGQMLYGGDDLGGEAWDHRDWVQCGSVREKLFWLAAEACLEL